MKQICLIILLGWFCGACTRQSHQQTSKTEAEVSSEDPNSKRGVVSFKGAELAYIQNGTLYFYDLKTDEPKAFDLEEEPVFNCVFHPQEDAIYYTVERERVLWLKKADLSKEEPEVVTLVNFNVKGAVCFSETEQERSALLFTDKNQIVLPHDFSWDTYNYRSMSVYALGEKKLKEKAFDYNLFYVNKKSLEECSELKKDGDDLLYLGGASPVNLTDALDFSKWKVDSEFAEERDFIHIQFSPEGGKVLFGVFLEFGDLPHGPYCVANLDGTHQRILIEDGISSPISPVWVGDRLVFHLSHYDEEKEMTLISLYETNKTDNSPKLIVKDVDQYNARTLAN